MLLKTGSRPPVTQTSHWKRAGWIISAINLFPTNYFLSVHWEWLERALYCPGVQAVAYDRTKIGQRSKGETSMNPSVSRITGFGLISLGNSKSWVTWSCQVMTRHVGRMFKPCWRQITGPNNFQYLSPIDIKIKCWPMSSLTICDSHLKHMCRIHKKRPAVMFQNDLFLLYNHWIANMSATGLKAQNVKF